MEKKILKKEKITKPTYKDDEQIITYDELEKHIGEFVYFSYGCGKYYYAWIKKITKVEIPKYLLGHTTEKEIKIHVNHLLVYGTYSMIMWRGGKKLEKPEPSNIKLITKEKMSNAQWAARLPTKEELKLYLNTIRKYRIFGDNI